MRAVMVKEFGSIDESRLESVPDPTPSAHEVLIEIQAAPINYVDLLVLAGNYQFKPSLPYTPGKGPAGVVRKVGADVAGLAPGDRVLAMAEYGGYAELIAVDQRQVYLLPDALSHIDAAAMSLGFDTAWMALTDRARLRPGESVLILGATGAVGGAAIQLAKAMGAHPVIAGVSSQARAAKVRADGADAIVDLSVPDLRSSIRQQVHDITQTGGVDIVIDPLGGDAFDGAIRSLAWRGRLVVIGFAAGRIPTLKMNYPLLKNIEVSGLQISDYRKRATDMMDRCYAELFRLYADGDITPPASRTFPLDDWQTAMRQLEERATDRRLILLPSS